MVAEGENWFQSNYCKTSPGLEFLGTSSEYWGKRTTKFDVSNAITPQLSMHGENKDINNKYRDE